MAEILLYGPIYDSSASQFIRDIDAVADGELSIRINSDGGSPESGWGMVAKMAEFDGNIDVTVDGRAHSMAAMVVAYAKGQVTAYDVSEFLIHRAAYPRWVENDPELFTEPLKQNLKRVNDSLRKGLESKIDVEAFEKETKVTLDDVFSMDGRLDVFLTAKQAKKIGLVSKVKSLTAEKAASINAMYLKAASGGRVDPIKPQTPKTMTLEELKTTHPEAYAQAVALGKKAGLEEGASQERDRVSAWLKFNHLDAEKVAEGINSGKKLSESETALADFHLASLAATQQTGLEKEAQGGDPVEGDPVKVKPEAKTEVEKTAALIEKELGITLKPE